MSIVFLLYVLLMGTLCIMIIGHSKGLPSTLNLIGAFLLGSIVSVEFIYIITSYITHSLDTSLYLFFISSTIIFVFCFKNIKKQLSYFSLSRNVLLILIMTVVFSMYLFTKSFSYDLSKGQFLIASHIYLDFGAHIPLIRSFSLGNDFPMQVPFFAEKNLLYYFMFDLYAGILEHLGMNIALAFNIISTISFTCILFLIYELSYLLFKRKIVGLVACGLFLFPSNLAFIDFFQQYGFSINALHAIWHNTSYFTTGPLGTQTIPVFWNLNTYLNQRHLIFGTAFFLYLVYLFVNIVRGNMKPTNTQSIFIAIVVGIFPYWHTTIFVILFLFYFLFLVTFRTKSKNFFIIGLITSFLFALPQFISIMLHSQNHVLFKPGFLIWQHLNINTFFTFWLWNLGLALFAILFAFLISDNFQRKIFLIFCSLFLLCNVFQFTPDMFDNHKFLTTWIIVTNIFIAYGIYILLQKQYLIKFIAALFLFFLTFSGVIHFFVVKNGIYTRITDYPHNRLLQWSLKEIPSNKIVFTNGEIYDPLSIIGKQTFLGNAHYIYLYGGDPTTRQKEKNIVLQGLNKSDTISILKQNHISYILLYKNTFAPNSLPGNRLFYESNFKKIYEDNDGVVYKI